MENKMFVNCTYALNTRDIEEASRIYLTIVTTKLLRT